MDIILPYIVDRYLDKQENDDNDYMLVDDTICCYMSTFTDDCSVDD